MAIMRGHHVIVRSILAVTVLGAILGNLPALHRAEAYDRYSVNRDATNCRACHGPFKGTQYHSKVDGSAWIAWWGPTDVHGGHEEMLFDGTTYQNGCAVCHMWDYFPVKLKTSRGAAPFNAGCLACHGRVEGSAGTVTGIGLIQHHYRAGITQCANCHPDGNPANYTPVGENFQPPGYFTPDPSFPLKPTDSCNRNGAENSYGSSRGLDLDGDLLYDLNDPDCTPGPDTSITSGPPSPTNSTSASFQFASTVSGSTFECDLDGGGFVPCTSPATYTSLVDGGHSFSVRAIDGSGASDPTPAVHDWTVDTVAPDTSITSAPPVSSNSTSATFGFGSTETGTFECDLDGVGFSPCTSPAIYTGLASGAHLFSVLAWDAAGNPDPTPATHGWTIITGLPCWDLNGNGGCDPAAEDKNGDGLCDILDCQSSSVPQAFDANGQYLGKFLGFDGDYLNIFLPSLRKSVRIASDDGDVSADPLYFANGTCTGQAYGKSLIVYSVIRNSGQYYTGSTAAPVPVSGIGSYIDGLTGQCTVLPPTSGMYVVPVTAPLPFTTPTALPIRLE